MTQPSSPAATNDSFTAPKKSPARHALSLTFLGLTLGLVTWAGQVLFQLVSGTEFSQLMSHSLFALFHSLVNVGSSIALIAGIIWLTRVQIHAPKLARRTRSMTIFSVGFDFFFPFMFEFAYSVLGEGHFLVGYLVRVIVHTLCTYLIFRFCVSLIANGPEPERAPNARKVLKKYLALQGFSCPSPQKLVQRQLEFPALK